MVVGRLVKGGLDCQVVKGGGVGGGGGVGCCLTEEECVTETCCKMVNSVLVGLFVV